MAVKLGYRNVFRDPYGFPQWQARGLPVQSVGSAQKAASEKTSDINDSQGIKGWGLIWTLLGVFLGGLALNLTPCVYPMIPITVSFFGGRSQEKKPTQLVLAMHGLCYLAGLCLTNSILGVAAALTGGLMGSMLQNPVVLFMVAGVLVLFASSLFGFWELRLPGFFTQAAGKSHSGYFGSLFMGLTLGVVAAPCIGPFVLGLVTWVAKTGNPWFGFLVFFILSLGLGLPLSMLALFSGQLQRLPKAGGWMIWVRRLMGWVLIGMAAHFLRPVLPEFLRVVLPVSVALAAGLHLGWLDANQAGFRAFPWLRAAVGVTCLVLATYWASSFAMRGQGVDWRSYSPEILREAAKARKPVIFDFYADWCTPCSALDEKTFHDPAVVSQISKRFIMIKVDVTSGGNPVNEFLLKKFGIKKVPTVVFLDQNGKERTGLRLVDFLPPDQFSAHMAGLQ